MGKKTYAGRIFQNPDEKREIWVCCGKLDWNDLNKLVYPDYDERLTNNGFTDVQFISLIEHVRVWGTIPEDLRERLKHPPQTPLAALGLARDVCEQLEGEQQLWLISWWQTVLWRQELSRTSVERLNRLRQQLLSFVQPRLAWEVTLLHLIRVPTH